MSAIEIQGYCPMGCGRTLLRSPSGYIKCGAPECPRPEAVVNILADPETEHIVELYAETFSVKHPLRERLDDALLDCPLGEHLKSLSGPPVPPGRYRASLHSHADGEGDDLWAWEPLDTQEGT